MHRSVTLVTFKHAQKKVYLAESYSQTFSQSVFIKTLSGIETLITDRLE
jgi:hypothetical protein